MIPQSAPTSWAAIWSAIAASFAALSSFLIWRIQHRNLLESVRPVLMLDVWSRALLKDDPTMEVITFQSIRNVGRGPALHVTVNCPRTPEDRPAATLSTTRVAIIAPGEAAEVNGAIVVHWSNVRPHSPGLKMLRFEVVAWYWDTQERVHEARYYLDVSSPPHVLVGATQLAHGLALTHWTATASPVWLGRLLAVARNVIERLRRFRFPRRQKPIKVIK